MGSSLTAARVVSNMQVNLHCDVLSHLEAPVLLFFGKCSTLIWQTLLSLDLGKIHFVARVTFKKRYECPPYLAICVVSFRGSCTTIFWQMFNSHLADFIDCGTATYSVPASFLIKSGQWSFHYEEKERRTRLGLAWLGLVQLGLSVHLHQLIFTFCLASWLGPKKQDFWPKIDCSQMKLPTFVNPPADSSSKIGHDFIYKVVQKLKSSKNYFHKKMFSQTSIFF